jgi:type IV pilus assembly protein PilV
MTPFLPAMNRLPDGRQRGVSLIEVLVAVVVLSLGLLAMAGLQLSGLRASQGGLLRSTAAQLASDMAERMRSNFGEAKNYALPLGGAPGACNAVCVADLNDWLQRVSALPAGDGSVEQLATGVVRITVQWDDSRAAGAANVTASHVLETRVWGF